MSSLGAKMVSMIKFVLLSMFAIVLDASATGKSDQLPPPAVMKTLGLIGGTSWYSTVDYYRYINKAVNEAYGNNTNPPLIVFNLNQHHINELQDRARWDEIGSIFVEAIEHPRERRRSCSAPTHHTRSMIRWRRAHAFGSSILAMPRGKPSRSRA